MENKDTKPTFDEKEFLNKVSGWNKESETLQSAYFSRWSKNIQLIKGIFPGDEYLKSKVRGKAKIFFRKIWAERCRTVATFYEAYLRDMDTFKVEGVDTIDDPRKAEVLQAMMEYRIRQMRRRDDLYVQFIQAFQDIWDCSWAVAKMTWLEDEDRPCFVLYPPEQVSVDMSAETPSQMQYIIFRNYKSEDWMREQGYLDKIDISELPESSMPSNSVRAARYSGQTDPQQVVSENKYPAPDKLSTQEKQDTSEKYEVWEIFWREKGKIKFAVSLGVEQLLKEPVDSLFGNYCFPVVIGMGLIEAHKLIGEGFPQVLEGPQESINSILNMRKDELALGMSPMSIVNRYANVDLASLVNVRVGGVVLADDAQAAVTQLPTANVTLGAYQEVAADEAMMNELSGVTPIKQGSGSMEAKATVAQINLNESNAKLDLLIAMVGETFMRGFYLQLANLIQLFETDKNVFRVANEVLRKKSTLMPQEENILDIDDFEADIILTVGLDKVSRGFRLQQQFLAIDKMVLSNQVTVGLLQVPGALPQGAKLFDITAVMEDVLPDLGMKNYRKYLFNANPPIPEQGNSGGPANIQGTLAPQVGGGIKPGMGMMQ